MSIQILGLREYARKNGSMAKSERFFERGWRYDNVDSVLANPELVLNKIPSKEQYNMYFTVAQCHEVAGRVLKEQHVIPYDIDNLAGITEEEILIQAKAAATAACKALGIEYNHTGVIFSGHGVQLFVKIPVPICDDLYFDSARHHYKGTCDIIQLALTSEGIPGVVDSSVFSAGRLMRFPCTENRKPNKPNRISRVLQANLAVAEGFYLDQKSGISAVQSAHQIDPNVLKRYPKPDTDAVLDECDFIRWNFEHSADVREPQWYAALSIVSRLDNGVEHCHRMSAKHPEYDQYTTELKAHQAEKHSGPRTCVNVATLWDGCKNCKHFGKITSPILIHGEDYIKTKDNGFREIKLNKAGLPIAGPVAFEDLVLQFDNEFSFVTVAEMRAIYVFRTTHWQIMDEPFIKEWTRSRVVPKPSASEMAEFCDRVRASNVKPVDWLARSTDGLMNFTNGILDLKTLLLQPHSKEVGFTNVLPYAYDRNAACPTWDKFMEDISMGDPLFPQMLNEFGGYSILGGPCLADKSLLLLGDGANGKSVYAETLAKVVGDGNYSTVFIKELANEQSRVLLVNKLFNYSDESSLNAFADSSYFKTLTTGGEIPVKEVYKPKYMYKNKAKLIILANELPDNADTTTGMYRRFLIADFERQFLGTDADKYLRDKLANELPGIVNKLISGVEALRQRNYEFITPKRSSQILDIFKKESDNVSQFCDECLTATDSAEDMVKFSDITAEYNSWCKENSQKSMSSTKLSRRLTKYVGHTSLIRDGIHVYRARTHVVLKPRNNF